MSIRLIVQPADIGTSKLSSLKPAACDGPFNGAYHVVALTEVSRALNAIATLPAATAPVGPVGPVAPVIPVGPVGPVGPVAPVIPEGPVGPVGPLDPCCASSDQSAGLVGGE